MPQPSETWFVRDRGRIHGPYTLSQLKSLRSRGKFSRVCEVSTDRRVWHPAAMLEGFSQSAVSTTESGLDAPQIERDASTIPEVRLAAGDASAIRTPPPTRPRRTGMKLKREQSIAAVIVGVLLVTSLIGFLADGSSDNQADVSDWTSSQSNDWTARPAGNRGSIPAAASADEKLLQDHVGFVVCGATNVGVRGADQELREIPFGTGSCFLVSREGFAITNRHVIENDESWNEFRKYGLTGKPALWVFFAGMKFSAEVVYMSDFCDMAVLKTNCTGRPGLRLSTVEHLPRGQRIFAVGFPGAAQVPLSEKEQLEDWIRKKSAKRIQELYKARDFDYFQTDGTISKIDREEIDNRVWIQHTANINPGNSGGPLLSDTLVVCGINTQSLKEAAMNVSLSMPQLRAEIDQIVPGVKWTEP